jgi:cytoskeletal protein RodZ
VFVLTELGNRLKEARLAKGLSLEDLQEMTKIQKRYLTGIEEGNYSIMPGSFYARAFIKQYAEAVGLNSDELLKEYQAEVPGALKEEVAQSFTKSPSGRSMKSSSSSKSMESMPKIIVALFIVAIVVIMAFLLANRANNDTDVFEEDDKPFEYETTTPPVEEEPVVTEEEEVEEVVEEEPVVTQVIGAGVVAGEDSTFDVSGTETLNIRVEVSGATWVGIRDVNRNEQIDDRVYNAGEVVEFDATSNAYARIRLGDINNAVVYINDEQLQYAQTASTQNIILNLVKEEQ